MEYPASARSLGRSLRATSSTPRHSAPAISEFPEEASKSGNIRVVCRFRPLNDREKAMNTGTCVTFAPDGTQVVVNSSGEGDALKFSFDHVFAPMTPQAIVYEAAAKPIVESVLEGFNGTVFAYGQTGSGKTFTMTGANIDDEELKGIIPRMISTVFSAIRSSSGNLEYTVKIGFCEIYMERIKDLLNPVQNNLKIREDNRRGVYIADLTEEYIADEAELYSYMKLGTANREVAATQMNEGSSRSHSLFIMTISQNNTLDFSAKTGKLYLVDLAGSEKVGKTGAEGKRLDEAKMINKSLSALGMVIAALTEGKATHVPYRDSKLTRVLQDSLGGNSKTSLIITCSPSPFNEAETISTLRFGTRAKQIKNKPKVNKEYTVAELKLLLSKADAEILRRERRIQVLEKAILDFGGTLPSEEGLLDTEEGDINAKSAIVPSAEMEEMHQELEYNQKLLSDQVAESDLLRSQLSESASNNKKLLVQRDDMNVQLQNLLTQLTKMEESSQDLETKVQTAQYEKDASEAYLAKSEEKNKELEAKLAAQEETIASLQIQLEGLANQVNSPALNRRTSMKHPQKDSAEYEIESGLARKDAEVQCFVSLGEDGDSVDELRASLDAERRKSADLSSELSRIRTTIVDSSSGQIVSFEQFYKQLYSQVVAELSVQTDRKDIQKHIEELSGLNDELTAELQIANKKYAQLQNDRVTEQSCMRRIIRELSEQTKSAGKGFETQKVYFKIQLTGLEKKLKRKDERLGTLSKELEDLRVELKEFQQREIAQLEEEQIIRQVKPARKPKRPVSKGDQGLQRRVSTFLALGLSPATAICEREERAEDEEERK